MDTVFNPILEVRNLNKSYKDFSLQNVSFSLPEGCITGFIGANGAGKTTTINTILGLAGMDSGSVRFFGMDICRQEQEIKDRIGVVMDGNYFYENLTLTQMKNVIAPAYSHWCEDDFQKHLAAFSLNPSRSSELCQKECVRNMLWRWRSPTRRNSSSWMNPPVDWTPWSAVRCWIHWPTI